MEATIRRTGVDVLGDVPWGTHMCLFYETKEDLIDILVPYFQAGLDNNEFCMWVTSEPLAAEDAKRSLKTAVQDLDDYVEKGQIEILDYSQWYTRSGSFEGDRVLQGWVEKTNRALERGFDGLRLTGNTFWLEEEDWQAFAAYEATVDRVIGQYRMLAICTYPLARCRTAEVMDVVSNHQFALIKRQGKWETIESAERGRAVERLRLSQEFNFALFEHNPIETIVVDLEGKVIGFNQARKRRGDRMPQIGDAMYVDYAAKHDIDMRGELMACMRSGELKKFPEQRYGDRFLYIKMAPFPQGAIITCQDITERKRAVEEIASLSRFPSENPNPVLRIAEDGTVLYANAAAEELLRGRRSRAGGLAPDDWREQVAEALRAGTRREFETTHEGRLFSFDVVPVPEQGYVNWYGRDITERKRAEEEVASLSRFPSENPHPVLCIAEDGSVLYANAAAEALLPGRRSRAGGLAPDDWREQAAEALSAGTRHEFETTHEGRLFSFDVVPQPESGYVNWYGRDITERKRAEEALTAQREKEAERVQAELDKVRAELVRTTQLAAIGQAAAQIAHELRNPLGSVHNAVFYLKHRPPKAEKKWREYLDLIEREVETSNRIVGGLLEATRHREPAREEVDLGSLARDAIARLRPAPAVQCRCQFDPDPFILYADPLQMRQVLDNLLNNAQEAMGESGEIQIGACGSEGSQIIIVQDTGPGVLPEHRDRIFDLLFTTKAKGTGLGLAICRQIIEGHGGAIDLESSSRGARFRIRLPATQHSPNGDKP